MQHISFIIPTRNFRITENTQANSPFSLQFLSHIPPFPSFELESHFRAMAGLELSKTRMDSLKLEAILLGDTITGMCHDLALPPITNNPIFIHDTMRYCCKSQNNFLQMQYLEYSDSNLAFADMYLIPFFPPFQDRVSL